MQHWSGTEYSVPDFSCNDNKSAIINIRIIAGNISGTFTNTWFG